MLILILILCLYGIIYIAYIVNMLIPYSIYKLCPWVVLSCPFETALVASPQYTCLPPKMAWGPGTVVPSWDPAKIYPQSALSTHRAYCEYAPIAASSKYIESREGCVVTTQTHSP
jgi:hypothetical protein